MKEFKLLLFLFLIFILYSCNGEDVETSSPSFDAISDIRVEVGSEPLDFFELIENLEDKDSSLDSLVISINESIDYDTLGNYTVIISVSDLEGNEVSESFIVEVVDTTAPVITLNGDASITLEVGSTYTELGANVSDNYDTDLSAVVAGEIDTNTVGAYTITYTSTDANGNSATAITRTINIVEPIIGNLKQIEDDYEVLPDIHKVILYDQFELYAFDIDRGIRIIVFKQGTIILDETFATSQNFNPYNYEFTMTEIDVSPISIYFHVIDNETSLRETLVYMFDSETFIESYVFGYIYSNDYFSPSKTFSGFNISIHSSMPIFIDRENRNTNPGFYTIEENGDLTLQLNLSEFSRVEFYGSNVDSILHFNAYTDVSTQTQYVYDLDSMQLLYENEKSGTWFDSYEIYTSFILLHGYSDPTSYFSGYYQVETFTGLSYTYSSFYKDDYVSGRNTPLATSFIGCNFDEIEGTRTCDFFDNQAQILTTKTFIHFGISMQFEFYDDGFLHFYSGEYINSNAEGNLDFIDKDGNISTPERLDELKNTAFQVTMMWNISYQEINHQVYVFKYYLNQSDDPKYLYIYYSEELDRFIEFEHESLISGTSGSLTHSFVYDSNNYIIIAEKTENETHSILSMIVYDIINDNTTSLTFDLSTLVDDISMNYDFLDQVFLVNDNLLVFYTKTDKSGSLLLKLDLNLNIISETTLDFQVTSYVGVTNFRYIRKITFLNDIYSIYVGDSRFMTSYVEEYNLNTSTNSVELITTVSYEEIDDDVKYQYTFENYLNLFNLLNADVLPDYTIYLKYTYFESYEDEEDYYDRIQLYYNNELFIDVYSYDAYLIYLNETIYFYDRDNTILYNVTENTQIANVYRVGNQLFYLNENYAETLIEGIDVSLFEDVFDTIDF